MTGFIKLHRKMRDNPVYADPHLLKLWIHCLMKATHTEHEQLIGTNTIVKLEPGQFVTGRYALATEYNKGVSPSKVVNDLTLWRWLKSLEKHQMLNIKTTNKYSVVSINNWCAYQQNEQQMNSKRTTNEQQMNTNKNVKNEKNEKKKDIVEKLKFSDNVSMTQKQYDELVSLYGKSVVDSKIEDMEIYKSSTGKKYKNDAMALKGWLKKDTTTSDGKNKPTPNYKEFDFDLNRGEDM